MLTLPSPAKLNLFLHITGKRSDGYHNLHTYFLLVDTADTLEFSVLPSGTIKLTILGSTQLQHHDDADNLIIKAAKALQSYVVDKGIKQSVNTLGASIRLKKVLPLGGGLGGGSSNAATTLLALNQLWQLGLSLDELAKLGASLGADVAVFVRGKSAFAQGIGEELTSSLPDALLPKPAFIVTLCPEEMVSTVDLFSHPDLVKDTPVLPNVDFTLQNAEYKNNFEPLVLASYPKIKQAFDYLSMFKAYIKGTPRLTGTGACVFAVFEDQTQAMKCLKNAPCSGFVSKGLAESPVHKLLGLN